MNLYRNEQGIGVLMFMINEYSAVALPFINALQVIRVFEFLTQITCFYAIFYSIMTLYFYYLVLLLISLVFSLCFVSLMNMYSFQIAWSSIIFVIKEL